MQSPLLLMHMLSGGKLRKLNAQFAVACCTHTRLMHTAYHSHKSL